MVVILWIVFALLVAFMGDGRRIGFFWALVAALFLSPLVGFVIVVLSPRKGSFEEELARVRGVKAGPPPPMAAGKGSGDVVERLEKLKALHEAGALSAEEYEAAKAQVLGK